MPKKKTVTFSDFIEEFKTPKKQKLILEGEESGCSSDTNQDLRFRGCDSPFKRKPLASKTNEELSVIQVFEDELDQQLGLKAKRSNLTAKNVKNMIKAVITDTEVLKMVDFSLQMTEEKPVYELKLTRAKTKELVGINQNALFNMPVQSKNSEIEALITQELPEDSSDEEYEPHLELSEDEESKVSDAGLIEDEVDLNSSISTIASRDDSARIENIGQRTRSKLCLSETPLEAIEQEFIPPDITTDMYDTYCDNEEWFNFLKEFTQPLDSNQQETNDDENDPEYNVMVDEEGEATDKEELRADRAVQVTKKELNTLISELFEYTDMLSSDEEDIHSVVVAGKTSELTASEVESRVDTSPICEFSEEQSLILKQQLQQHVQLLLQSCLMLCGVPDDDCDDLFNESKTRLQELKKLSQLYTNSYFRVLNLESSLKLVDDWVDIALNSSISDEISDFLLEEQKKCTKTRKKKTLYLPQFPSELIELCVKSDAFLYPLFLPSGGFVVNYYPYLRIKFSSFEDFLLVIGLEEFSEFTNNDIDNNQDLIEVVSYVQHYLLPARTVKVIYDHIKRCLSSTKPCIIKEFFSTKKAPSVRHFVVVHTALKPLSEYPSDYFHDRWKKYF